MAGSCSPTVAGVRKRHFMSAPALEEDAAPPGKKAFCHDACAFSLDEETIRYTIKRAQEKKSHPELPVAAPGVANELHGARVNAVLFDHLGGVEHLELLARVLPGVEHD